MSDNDKRYILVQDGDTHWYVIPRDCESDWFEWVDSEEDDVPDYATRIGGGPSLVSFTNWKIG